MALYESSHGQSTAAGGLYLESRNALPRVGSNDCAAVFSVPLVRGRESEKEGMVGELFVKKHSDEIWQP